MLANRGEDSSKKDSRRTAAPTPTVAAAAGTVIYQNSYGDTKAPAEAQKKRGKRLKTMLLADQGEDSRKKDSMMTAAPTPSVAAAAGTLIYQNQYGVTDAPPVVLASDEEVDYMTDGNILISRSSKEPEANKNPNDTVGIADYRNDAIAVSGGKSPGKKCDR